MKKILILLILLLVGCEVDLTNTPTKKVEVYLSKYQTLDDGIIARLEQEIDDDITLTADQRDKYLELWKKHYQGLIYTIKDEKTDGNVAIVTTEIEVNDYTTVLNNANKYLKENANKFNDKYGEYDISKFNDYKLEELSKTKERVKFTIEFEVRKNGKKWVLGDLNEIDSKKLTGMYEYQVS